MMDVWTVLWYNGKFAWNEYVAALITAIPFMILYAVSNCIFIVLLAKPIDEKMTRIQKKYGI